VKVAIIDNYYPAFLADHYACRPRLADSSYDEQLAALMERSFGTADAYSQNLRELGHEAIDLIVNCEPLQAAWAREHDRSRLLGRLGGALPGLPGRVAQFEFLHRVAAAQLRAFEPDVVYCQDFWFLRRSDLEALRAEGVLVVGQCGSELPSDERPYAYDLITTSFPHFVDRLRARGVDTEYLRIAFDERVLERLREQDVVPEAAAPRDLGAVFVGGIHPPSVHRNGVELLEHLCLELSMDVWGYVANGLAPNSPIHAHHHGPAWGLDMYRVLARTRIAINRHGDIAEGYANNMRLFEATGVGALLMTEAATNLSELFEPGQEIVSYESAEDLVDKARYYLENEQERVAIASAGQNRTLAEHTYRRVMADLAEMLEQRLRP
jgi:hypothetical protein